MLNRARLSMARGTAYDGTRMSRTERKPFRRGTEGARLGRFLVRADEGLLAGLAKAGGDGRLFPSALLLTVSCQGQIVAPCYFHDELDRKN